MKERIHRKGRIIIKKLKPISYEESHRINENGELEKWCNHHEELFPEENPWMSCTEEYFYKNRTSKRDGLNTYCKKCAKAKSLKNRWDNIDRSRETSKQWNRKNVDVIEKANKKYRKTKIKEKQEYQSNYYKLHPDKLKGYNETRNHKNHNITEKEWEDCKKYFNHRCCYCDLKIEEHYIVRKGIRKLGDFHKEHADHFGENNLSNCIPSCGSCNSSKWEFPLDNWYTEENSVFSQNRYNKIMEWLNGDYEQFIESK